MMVIDAVSLPRTLSTWLILMTLPALWSMVRVTRARWFYSAKHASTKVRQSSRHCAISSQLPSESGWQLSQGERSRLYIARALLQNAELVILDESFDALDPETCRQALDCVVRRASALLVIAHT